MRADFLGKVAAVDVLCGELVRRNAVHGWKIPVAKITMLFCGDL